MWETVTTARSHSCCSRILVHEKQTQIGLQEVNFLLTYHDSVHCVIRLYLAQCSAVFRVKPIVTFFFKRILFYYENEIRKKAVWSVCGGLNEEEASSRLDTIS